MLSFDTIPDVYPVEQKRIRVTEPDGTQLCGYWWIEPRPALAKKRELVLIALVLAAAATGYLYYEGARTGQPSIALWSIPFALVTAGLFIWQRRLGHAASFVNALAFNSRGEILLGERPPARSARNGPPQLVWKSLGRSAGDIMGISMPPMKNNAGSHYKHLRASNDPTQGYFAYHVVIDFTSGERFNLGDYFDDNDARVVTVQLQQALEESAAHRP